MIRRAMGAFVTLVLVATLLLPLASVGAQEEENPGTAPVVTEQTQPESETSAVETEPPVAEPQPEAPPAEPPAEELQPEAPPVDSAEQQPVDDTSDPATDGSAPASADSIPAAENETAAVQTTDDVSVEPSDESGPSVIENLIIDCSGLVTYDVVEAHGEALELLIELIDYDTEMDDLVRYPLSVDSEGPGSLTVDMSANPSTVVATIDSSAVDGPIAQSGRAKCRDTVFEDGAPEDDEDDGELLPSSISNVSVTCDGAVTFTIDEANGDTLQINLRALHLPAGNGELGDDVFEATETGTFTVHFDVSGRNSMDATVRSNRSGEGSSATIFGCTEDEDIWNSGISGVSITCDAAVAFTIDSDLWTFQLTLYGSNSGSWQSIDLVAWPSPVEMGSQTHAFTIPADTWDRLRVEVTSGWTLFGVAEVSGCLDDDSPDPGDGTTDFVSNFTLTCDGQVAFTVNDLVGHGMYLTLYGLNDGTWQSVDEIVMHPAELIPGDKAFSLTVPPDVWDRLRAVITDRGFPMGSATVSGCLGGDPDPEPTDGVQISNLRLFCNGLTRFDVATGEPANLLTVLWTDNMEGWQRTSSGTFETGSQEVRFGVPAGWFDDLSVAIVQDGHTLASASVAGCLTSDPNEITGDQILVFTGYGSVLFDRVTEGGETIIAPYFGSYPGQGGFPAELDQDSAMLFSLSTTATFEGSIQVCLAIPETENPDQVRMLQTWHGAWIEVDTEVHVDQGIACTNTNRLGMFATALLAGDPEPEPVLPVVTNLVATCAGLVTFDLETTEPVELQVWVGTPAQAPGFAAETYITATTGPQQVQLDIPVGRFDRHTVFVALDAEESHELATTTVSGCRDQTADPNTPAGSDIVVEVGGVSVGFDYVNMPGVTTVTLLDPSQAPPLPAEFDENTAILLDISTTAVFEGTARVCVPVGADFGDMATARLLHFENGAWVDITTSVDPGSRTICGQTSSFSPFAVVKLSGQEPGEPGHPGPKPGESQPPSITTSDAATGGSNLSGLPNTGSGASPERNGAQTVHILLAALALLVAGSLRISSTRTRGTRSR